MGLIGVFYFILFYFVLEQLILPRHMSTTVSRPHLTSCKISLIIIYIPSLPSSQQNVPSPLLKASLSVPVSVGVKAFRALERTGPGIRSADDGTPRDHSAGLARFGVVSGFDAWGVQFRGWDRRRRRDRRGWEGEGAERWCCGRGVPPWIGYW